MSDTIIDPTANPEPYPSDEVMAEYAAEYCEEMGEEIYAKLIRKIMRELNQAAKERDDAVKDLEFRRGLYAVQETLVESLRKERDDALAALREAIDAEPYKHIFHERLLRWRTAAGLEPKP